jgi:predicted class III extradiol MEMO1 family dioxygenase
MVGNLTKAKEKEFGRKLAPYLSDSSNLFIISSDFCHWGANFDFFYNDKSDGEVWQSVEKLDKTGMKLIEDQDA